MVKSKKDDIITGSMIIILFLAIGINSYLIVQIRDTLLKPVTLDFQNVQLEPEHPDIQVFVATAERFAKNHKYTDGYNCINYSNDLKDITDELGFKTQIIKGCTTGENITCHEWLRLAIDFEPQHAVFKDYSVEYPEQEVVG